MRNKYFFILLILVLSSLAFHTPIKKTLSFNTITGHNISVKKGQIFYDKKPIQTIKYSVDIIYDSKYNRLIEDHGAVFLFVAMAGKPNADLLNVYTITPKKAILSKRAILSEIKDYDKDGFLEFGGHDITEYHPNSDSAYYLPSTYFEIRNGEIRRDLPLTKREDIKINGIYLPPTKQRDKDGNCCTVIKRLKKLKN